MTDSFLKSIRGVLIFVGLIWCVYFVGLILPFDINSLGILPRSLRGLVGIPLAPFLHANLQHLVSNTVPLIILLCLVSASRAKNLEVIAGTTLLGGALLWVFGRPMIHIGASGLIYGLITFLIIIGFLERKFGSLAISILVALIYGGTLLSGVIPNLNSHQSWDGHLCGGIAGGLIAFGIAKSNKSALRTR